MSVIWERVESVNVSGKNFIKALFVVAKNSEKFEFSDVSDKVFLALHKKWRSERDKEDTKGGGL